MKKATSLVLAFAIMVGLILTGCGGANSTELDLIGDYMPNDDTVIVTFRNESNTTITHVQGNLNLFTGSSTSQTPISMPSFSWSGSCEEGETFDVTVHVDDSYTGMADDVNRVGFHISSIS